MAAASYYQTTVYFSDTKLALYSKTANGNAMVRIVPRDLFGIVEALYST